MAQLKSVAEANLQFAAVTVYEVSPTVKQVKVSELILANNNTTDVNVMVKVYKAETNSTINVIPNVNLLALESKFIPMSTFLTTGDSIIVQPKSKPDPESDDTNIDVMVSCIEV